MFIGKTSQRNEDYHKKSSHRQQSSGENQSRRFELLGYPQPSSWSRSAQHLLTSQMVINSQDPHLQQILRDDALAVCLELFHVPLRVDEAAAEVLGAGEGEVEGCGGGESSWIGIG